MPAPAMVALVVAASLAASGALVPASGAVATDPVPEQGATVQTMELTVDPTAAGETAVPNSSGVTPSPAQSVTPEDDAVVAGSPVGEGRVATPAVEVDGVQTVGVTWPSDTDGSALDPRVRTRVDGRWSSWQVVPVSDEAPDPGTADDNGARGGTDSVYVGDVDAVQLSVEAVSAPTGTELALIGSPDSTAASAVSRVSGSITQAVAVAASVAAPAVISREQWGASPAACTPDVASSLVGAVVHHTAGSNDYSTVAQAEQQIRNDQAYHINSRGWCDIGYNFVVDKWGNIYEGRDNSLSQAVIGVHAGGFNTGTVGVAMLGTYGSVVPSDATIEAVGNLIGFRLGSYGVDPNGSMQYTTGAGENSRFQNTTVTLPRVMGHRDVAYTACPGDAGYAQLGTIRAVAARTAGSLSTDVTSARLLVKALYQDLLGRAPDSSGLDSWTAITVGSGPGETATQIAHQPEYVLTEVAEAYRSVLGREPDQAGLLAQAGAVQAGTLRTEDLRGRLLASDEYWLRVGGTYNALIDSMYRYVLGRAPRVDEVQYWTQQAQATGDRQVISTGIWYSLEGGVHRVDDVYLALLSRHADPTGLNFWPYQWLAHGDDGLRAGISNSEEYRLRATARFA